jgi:cell wall-associated NlpC family hydrolase
VKKKIAAMVSTILFGAGLVTPALAADTVYVVKKGDTLTKIAALYGTTVKSIVQENHLSNPNYIVVGQKLLIPSSISTKQRAVVATAESLVGKYPYVWGGHSPADGGFDCSGFIEYVYKQNGITLPREAHDQAYVGTPVPANQLQPGDLVFFKNTYPNSFPNKVTHVSIYLGNNRMAYASSSRNTVIVTTLWGNPYWESHYWGAKRVIK